MNNSHFKPKRYKGDNHAVVAMILRPITTTTTTTSEHFQQIDSEEEDREIPLPVRVLSQDQLSSRDEEQQQADDPMEGFYTEEYWTKEVKETLLKSEMLFILRSTNKRDRWSGQVGLPGGRK